MSLNEAQAAHRLKLTVDLEVAAVDIHAAKAVIAAKVRELGMEREDCAPFGSVTIIVGAIHVAEKKPRNVAAPEPQPELEPKE